MRIDEIFFQNSIIIYIILAEINKIHYFQENLVSGKEIVV